MSYPLARSCIKAYVKMAHDKGASQNELIEFLEVAMTMQGLSWGGMGTEGLRCV
jgi:alkylhydroperoxidase/carboxymuconolactone decarboxylase family protein YurZ